METLQSWDEVMWGAMIMLLAFASLVVFLFPKQESKPSYVRLWVIAMLIDIVGFVVWFLIYFSYFL